jgi:hypothetical protein
MDIKEFRSEIWGPHYWFVIHTIAYNYPNRPNPTIKRKYYDFIMNMPILIPDPVIGETFSKLLDKYPVTPYMDHKSDFQKWVHFIHNQINERLGKPQISLQQAYNDYAYKYKPIYIKFTDSFKIKRQHIFMGMIMGMVGLIYLKGL